jgi:hypothetical protein
MAVAVAIQSISLEIKTNRNDKKLKTSACDSSSSKLVRETSRMSNFVGVFRPSFAVLARGRKGVNGAVFVPIPSYGAEPKTPPPTRDPKTGWVQGQSQRVGVLARKIGMLTIFDEWSVRRAVTAIKVRKKKKKKKKHALNKASTSLD